MSQSSRPGSQEQTTRPRTMSSRNNASVPAETVARARTTSASSSQISPTPNPRHGSASSGGAVTERTSLLGLANGRPIRVKTYSHSGESPAKTGESGAHPESIAFPTASSDVVPRIQEAVEEDADPTVSGLARELLQHLRQRTTVPAGFDDAIDSSSDVSYSASYDAILFEHTLVIDPIFPEGGGDDEPEAEEGDERTLPFSASPSDSALLLCATLLLLSRMNARTPVVDATPMAVLLHRTAQQRKFALGLIDLAKSILDGALLALNRAHKSRTRNDVDAGLVAVAWSDAPLSSQDPSCVCPIDLLYLLHTTVAALRKTPSTAPFSTVDLHPLLSHPVISTATELAYVDGFSSIQSNHAPSAPRSPRPLSVSTEEEASLHTSTKRPKSRGANFLAWIDSFAIPTLLHAHALILWAVYFAITVWLALFSEAEHLHFWNALTPRTDQTVFGVVARGFAWWWWVFTTVGYIVIYFQTSRRGPLSRLFISSPTSTAGAFTALPYVFAAFALVWRYIAILGPDLSEATVSYTFIAWSVPLLALSAFVLPSNIPALNPSTIHLGTLQNTLPRTVLEASAIEFRLGSILKSISHFGSFLLLSLLLLVFGLQGDIDLTDPLRPATTYFFPDGQNPLPPPETPIRVAPFQGRLAIAVGIFVGLGGAIVSASSSSIALVEYPKTSSVVSAPDSAFARMVSDSARLDRLRVVRHFLANKPLGGSPTSKTGTTNRNPPLPAPLNLVEAVVVGIPSALFELVARGLKRDQERAADLQRLARMWRRAGSVWLWRLLVAPALVLLFGWPRAFRAVGKMAREYSG